MSAAVFRLAWQRGGKNFLLVFSLILLASGGLFVWLMHLQYTDKVDVKSAIPALKQLQKGGSPEVRKFADNALKQLESTDQGGVANP